MYAGNSKYYRYSERRTGRSESERNTVLAGLSDWANEQDLFAFNCECVIKMFFILTNNDLAERATMTELF